MLGVHPTDCPAWEYADHPDASTLLPERSKSLLIALRAGHINHKDACIDSRSIHRELFNDLAPSGFEYYVGHYRGEHHRCLRLYNVMIRSDSRVGVQAQYVNSAIQILSDSIGVGMSALDSAQQAPNTVLPKEQKIAYLISFACKVFVEFLRVHPYVNGNGHIGRFIIFAILIRYGLWPKRWPLNDRPPDPPYSELIKRYRDGDCAPLEGFVMKCILGTV